MRKNQRGDAEVVAFIIVVLLVLGVIFAALFIRFKLSNEVVSGIVYNTTTDAPISGNTNFSVRAAVDTYVTEENESSYCLPPNSPYEALIQKAAEDKNIKVVVTAHKYDLRFVAPFTCVDNVTVTEVK